MENFRLKVFREVAERRSFTQAAEALFLTQPAVTLQIKALEDHLGVRLFDRSGGRVSLTAAGETLLGYAREIEALTEEAERAVAALRGEERGRLALGASTTIAQYLLPRLAGEFSGAHPGIDLSIVGANTESIVERLGAATIDLGLIEGPTGRPGLKTERFIEDEIVVIVPAGHEWASGAPSIEPAELGGRALVLREKGSGTRQVVETALKSAGLRLRELRIALELDSTEAIKSAVEAGLGIGFVSRWGLVKERRLGTLVEVPVAGLRMGRDFQFVYPRGPEPGGPAGAFLRFARSRRRSLAVPRVGNKRP